MNKNISTENVLFWNGFFFSILYGGYLTVIFIPALIKEA